jgi:putative sigma-54 modulation protein
MKFIVSGKNMEVTPALRAKVIKKLEKLDKFFKPDTEVQVTMGVERSRHIIEVTIPFNGVVIRAEEATSDMYASIDKVIDIIERQIRKYKTKIQKRIRDGALNNEYLKSLQGGRGNEDDSEEEEDEFKIVRIKRFAIKPMNVEEAILQMNLLGHEFFVFSNADSNQVNVVYKRKDGNYGLIEPEF